ncbi:MULTISPECIES: hypothetical protein [Flavobacterium]|jgi:hypothetical protein|uniref:Uncharacterized protein n=1 Tax=Flavobacterium anhuiense TaxID=459526 RepID=A0AAC9D3A9_9FLAO|nr:MULTISPECIES: hypothetical protein [Flavobacterium]AOC96845.1 hypothetical protein BB050_03766 [Flavobacterium anhuiense]EJG02396.1 hypothetical protein FF52_06935 [Flavobacterium sp. F52]URM35809.1 hypothetical protein LLY39_15330 [Flavobacterium anhuiense]SCY42596.1 hypothetical protein SAMN02927916_2026 [Flavobacterium anhuiense]
MKKYLLLAAILCTSITFAQTITSKQEEASIEQYELLKKVNQYYPDITLSKSVTNFYADGKIIDSQQDFDLRGTKFSSYKLGIEPGNKKVKFDYTSSEAGHVYGDVTIFNGNALRTTFNEKTNQVDVSLNGKSVYLKKL